MIIHRSPRAIIFGQCYELQQVEDTLKKKCAGIAKEPVQNISTDVKNVVARWMDEEGNDTGILVYHRSCFEVKKSSPLPYILPLWTSHAEVSSDFGCQRHKDREGHVTSAIQLYDLNSLNYMTLQIQIKLC